MRTTLQHMQVNIDMANAGFYRDLLTFLGWTVLTDTPNALGMGSPNRSSLWFGDEGKAARVDYDGRGAVNHIAMGAESVADVDAAASYIADRGVPALFETPRHRPEFAASPDKTYYQVMFEAPDGVLFEVVYIGAL